MTVQYSPGPWWAAVSATVVVVLPEEADRDALLAVWRTVADGAGFAGVLGTLTRLFGTDLLAIPPFAIVDLGGAETRVTVRGALRVETVGGPAAGVVSGEGVTTWSERLVVDAVALRILSPAVADEPWLPLERGVARVGAVTVGLAAGADTIQPAEPSTVAAASVATTDADALAPAPEATEPDPGRTLVELAEATSATAEPEPGNEYDELWGATVARSVEDAAIRPLEPEGEVPLSTASAAPEPPSPVLPDVVAPPAPSAAPSWQPPVLINGVPSGSPQLVPASATPEAAGDHDGRTISLAELRRMQQAEIPVPSRPAAVSSAGRVVLSTGASAPIDGVVVIGRKPSATRSRDGALPRLLTVPSPQQDISRSHVEIRLEGGSVLATDLNTTNGTKLVRAGQDPVLLHPGESTILVSGDALDLGDGIVATLEDLP